MVKKAPAPPLPPEIVEIDGVPHEVQTRPWGDIGIGSIIWAQGRRRWTCIAERQPEQFRYGRSCWLRFRAPNGEEFTAEPRLVTHKVKLLIDPAAPPVEPAWADGAKEAWLLATELGAIELATQDTATGEVWCPDYLSPNPDLTGVDPLLLHLEICHGIDVAAVREQEWPARHQAAHSLHEQAHGENRALPFIAGGFPHRHIPEDLDIITGGRS